MPKKNIIWVKILNDVFVNYYMSSYNILISLEKLYVFVSVISIQENQNQGKLDFDEPS